MTEGGAFIVRCGALAVRMGNIAARATRQQAYQRKSACKFHGRSSCASIQLNQHALAGSLGIVAGYRCTRRATSYSEFES